MPKKSSQSPQELRREAHDIESSGRSTQGKNPSNVAGGKKAAATRKEHRSGRGR